MFFGNCSGGYGGCQNQTTFTSLGGGTADCSKTPVAGVATCGQGGLPAVSFKGGSGQPVAPRFIPPVSEPPISTHSARDSYTVASSGIALPGSSLTRTYLTTYSFISSACSGTTGRKNSARTGAPAQMGGPCQSPTAASLHSTPCEKVARMMPSRGRSYPTPARSHTQCLRIATARLVGTEPWGGALGFAVRTARQTRTASLHG